MLFNQSANKKYMKVKLKLPISYYVSLTQFLKDLDTTDFQPLGKDILTQQILSTNLRELNKMLIDVVYLNSYYPLSGRKLITKSFPASYGLNFFGLFYGSEIEGFHKVAISEVCRQLEKQLFIAGPYKLPNYVRTSKN